MIRLVAILLLSAVGAAAQGPGAPPPEPAAPPEPPPTAEASATVDLTGYWVALVTEDWHWRMSVAERGDVASIPFTNDEEKRAILDAWDPVQDEADGLECRAYGAAAIMRIPTRVNVTWENEDTLRLETDAGMQTRLFRFGDAATAADLEPGERTWQGVSRAEWDQPGGRGARGRGRGAPPGVAPGGGPAAGGAGRGAQPEVDSGPAVAGALKVVTTNLRSGYLRRNGVPYSEDTTVTEYFHRTEEDYGYTYMIVTTIVEDPEYLTGPFITSSHFRLLEDDPAVNGWNPMPCSAL